MNPKHTKGIFLTICIVFVCVFTIEYMYASDSTTCRTHRRGLATERTQIERDSHLITREELEKKLELDLEEFLPQSKNRREGEGHLPAEKVERVIEEHLPEKKDKPDVEKPLPAKKDELDVEKTSQAKKDKPDVQKLFPPKTDERNVEENLSRRKDKPNVEKYLPERKNKPDDEKLLQAMKVERNVNEHLPGKKAKSDVEKLFRATKSEPYVAGKNESSVELLTEVPIAESIRGKLRQTVVHIEEDVFSMNVTHILTSMPIVPFDENRLVHKIQRAQRDPKYKCVIRIAKYCAKRCHHYILNGHEVEEAETFYQSQLQWKTFPCDFAQPCQVETRFVGNVTSDITDMLDTADVIFFIASLHEELQLMQLTASRPPGQLWTLYSRECPHHDPEYAPRGLTGNPFNLTMTHSREADIYYPYCTIQKKQVRPPPIPKKTKLIAWMASNCHLLSWRRSDFVRELEKHLAVDAYGKCGSLGPLLSDPKQVLPIYKFYLALENSECKDYITEKIWRTCLLQGIVPIVYGAKREDYEQTLPKNSFIYIEDFSNMSAFVDFIHELDSDNAQYEKYFEWRKEEQVFCLQDRRFTMLSPEANMWYLLRKLIHLYIHPETSWQKRTPNFASWWHGQCPGLTREKSVLGFNVHPERQRRKNSQHYE